MAEFGHYSGNSHYDGTVEMHFLLHDIGIAIIAATLFGLLAHAFKQPLILGYLIAGAMIGPELGFGFIQSTESIEIISELGLVLLLFVIGLELNLKDLVKSGRQLLLAGFAQFPLCVALGALLFLGVGSGLVGSFNEGLYFAVLGGLSSTAVVVKLLYDKRELDTIPGRLTIGILVIQDIYAIFLLAFQPNFSSPELAPILKAMLGIVVLLGAGFLISKFLLRRVFAAIATTPEIVLAVSIGWCALVAAIAQGLGLSTEMGALVAGVSIAAFPYSIHVTAKTLPLRDFFLTLFFVSLGMKITALTPAMIGPMLALIGVVLVSRFLTIYPLLIASGAGRRVAFVTSLNLSQISEFSLVIASLGVHYGHIEQQTVGVTIYAMAVTALISTYCIRLSHPLYLAYNRAMERIRPERVRIQETHSEHLAPEIVLLGFHRTARAFVSELRERAPEQLDRLLVIDFTPQALKECREQGIAIHFGDIGSMDTLVHAHIEGARLMVSTLPDMLLRGIDNIGLVKLCKEIAPEAMVAVTADDAFHESRLRAAGADFVNRPNELCGGWFAELVTEVAEQVPQSAAADFGRKRASTS